MEQHSSSCATASWSTKWPNDKKRVADSDKTKDATKDTTVPGAVKKKPSKANPRTLNTPVPTAAEARSGWMIRNTKDLIEHYAGAMQWLAKFITLIYHFIATVTP